MGTFVTDPTADITANGVAPASLEVREALLDLRDHASGWMNVKSYGAKGDGTTDDTAAIQAAIKAAGLSYAQSDWFTSTNPAAAPAQVVQFASGTTYKIAGTVCVPQGVIVDFNGATLLGTGNNGNVLFESGYYSGGVLGSNWGTAPESHRLVATGFRNGRFVACKIALHLYNFNEGCAVEGCTFWDVRQSLVLSRGFYSRLSNLYSRWPGGANTDPAYYLTDTDAGGTHTGGPADNVISLDGVYCDGGGRSLCFLVDGGASGLRMQNCSAENAGTGIKIETETSPLTIDNCYFESLSGTGIDLTFAAAHRSITIENNWFYQVGVGIDGVQMLSGKIGSGNYFSPLGTGVPVPVRINDNATSPFTVEIPSAGLNSGHTSNGIPALPAGYALGTGVNVCFPVYAQSDATGAAQVRQNFTGGLIALPFSGAQGFVSGQVPFASYVIGASTVTVTTSITCDRYVVGVFNVAISDNAGTYVWAGRFYGSGGGASPFQNPVAFLDGTTHGTRTIALSAVGGKLVMTFGGLTAPISEPEGVIRMC